MFVGDNDIQCEAQTHDYCFVLAGEFQNSKLAALQKVLQSEFMSAVREVYENVYETVDMTGSPEVRANATAKVCVILHPMI